MEVLDATYTPENYESKIWDFWMQRKFFESQPDAKKDPFIILMPPPNITSSLHMGHGTGYTIQDLLIRWNRMSGKNTCWLPGTDHAGIATQMMVEKSLEAEGKTRKQLGRPEFEKRLHNWKDKYGGIIISQFAKLGFSCDCSRLSYTMDPKLSDAVRHVFVKLFEEGLIYRGERLVNWDPVLQTALSDDEIETEEVNGFLYTFRYPVEGTSEFIAIATTRPETMLGDMAVAVSPTDERYTHLVGKMVRLPFTDRLIPIIADDYVKSEFGTGAVKITPAHDPNDFEIGKRHNLPFMSVMNDDATMAANTPERFRGMDRFVARKEVVKALKELELYDGEKSYRHAVPHSERSKSIIEPKLSLQWYVSMKELAAPAAEAARSGDLTFYPESWKKTYLYWLDNIQDWCISRQLWWGHRIPIWYCQSCSKTTTGMTDPTACSHCQSKAIKQDEDVLDTWFSSWLWPLSPFGWPEQSADEKRQLDYYYPSDVLVTAPEIIFLWVARMVMAGLKFKGKVPFKDIYFNATVCDKKGRKFSKTLGNGIDPLEVIKKHGADAVRYTAVSLAPLGGRVRMEEADFEHGARFVNKIWNASRFIFKYVEPTTTLKSLSSFQLHVSEKWLLHELQLSAQKAEKHLQNYRVNDAVETAYQFMWNALCDWGIEAAKGSLFGTDEARKEQTLSVLIYALNGALRLLHPVIPFITEEIWQKLPNHPDWDRPESLTIAAFPSKMPDRGYGEEWAQWQRVQGVVADIRSCRAQSVIPPKTEMDVVIRTDEMSTATIMAAESFLKKIASVKTLTVGPNVTKPAQALSAVGKGYEVYLPVAGLLDIDKEKKRLSSEMARISKIVGGLQAKLNNQDFVAKAPEDVLQTNREQLANMEQQLQLVTSNLNSLS